MKTDVDWIDAESKRQIAAKLNLLTSYVGYHDNMFNATYMQELYNFTLSKNFFLNGLTIFQANYKFYFGRLRQKFDDDLVAGPAIVDAFYYTNANRLYLPAAILQFPFFDFDLPDNVNFGGIGLGIGHEITHGFDDQGRFYDKDGNYNRNDSLWSAQTVANFKVKAQCMVDQYDKYLVKQVNMRV